MRKFLLLFLFIGSNVLSAQTVDSLQYVLGKFNPKEHPAFREVEVSLAVRNGMYLRIEVLTAFAQMKKVAKDDGVDLQILSATRNFNSQKRIWEAKWNGTRKVGGKNLKETIGDPKQRARKILRYSSMPGTSRHHWGTDIDINSLSPAYFMDGKGKTEYEWLRDNAHLHGFCQVYSVKDEERPNGYEEEKWHWSYMPIASKLIAYHQQNVKGTDISGFDGSDALPFSEVLKYVMGVAKDCQ